MKKHFTAHVIFAATALASQQVWALGFGRAVSDAVLGQAFTFTVPVNVDPGERFGLDCMSTEVYYGDVQLLPNVIRTDVQRGTADNTWIVRITAAAPVEEPIVEVALSAGCERRFTRRFTVFADPPVLGATAAQLPQLAPTVTPLVPAAATPPRASATPSTTGSRDSRAARHGASAAGSGRPNVVRKGPTMALANELNAPPAAAPSARHVVDAGSARKPGPRVATPAVDDAPRLLLDAGTSHLKLDMEEPIIPVVSAASGAVMALSDLDDPDTRRLRALEQSIRSVKHDSQVQSEQAAKLQAELAQSQSRSDWLPWLAGLLAIALAAIVVLIWKLRQQNRMAHSDWFNESKLGALTPPAPVAEAPPVLTPATALRDHAHGASADAFADSQIMDDSAADGVTVVHDVAATRPLDRKAMAAAMVQEATPRELSVEELLDLEQQADFFIALGQEDAAVDLLMSHLRSAGGQSPLPYTKLLEIYRRQGDRAAYERTRARFNRRFNAYAPDWDTGPAAGRPLEDYPETVALVETVWHSPIDAMAILEGLLFKRDDTSELFDLPAYRDVLLLYSLARDLWQHGGGNTGTPVDVLLPLDDSGPALTQVSQVPYPSAREVNDLDLPLEDPGLDLDSVDVEGDTRAGMLTSFEMTGFDHGQGGGRVDVELPQGEGDVHATLDEMSLTPAAPVKPRPAPHDWHDSDGSPDSELPTRR